MNILIDASPVNRTKAGVGVYATHLIDRLAAAYPEHRFYVLAQNDDPDMDFSRFGNVTMLWVHAGLFRIFPFRVALEQFLLPLLAVRHKIDIVHSLHYAFPLFMPAARRIVTIHDMTFFRFPELHERLKVAYFRFFLRASARIPEGLIFISEATHADYRARFASPRGRAFTIPHGTVQPRAPLPEEVKETLDRLNVQRPFVLYVGTLEPRKNIARLVRAFGSIAGENAGVMLVLAGKRGWGNSEMDRALAASPYKDRIRMPGFISDADKFCLLASTAAFVYPSCYEGFGLPVLEGLAVGAPIVTTNVSAMPEIARDAAVLVDPDSEEELVQAMRRVLEDSSLEAQLRDAGLRRAAAFTWERTAAMTLRAYKELAGAD